jgi:uncharacterized protein (DUF1015 family)
VTRIRPFQALRYDPTRVDLDRVLVPPYDVISPSDRAAFYERDPHNAIRLELTREVEDESSTDYSEIRETLDAWQSEGVLVRDPAPALYGVRQCFTAPDGGEHEREGFFALLHLEDYAARIVRPHERTLAGPKADRLKLIRAARANLSVVFLLYEDREQEVARALAASFDGAGVQTYGDPQGSRHSVTTLTDPGRIAAVSSALSERSLVIADGHHRYETALAYRDECRTAQPGAGPDAPHEWLLVYLANAYAPGTLLLPIHRLIRKAPVPTEAAWSERMVGWQRTGVPVPSADAVPDLLAKHLAPLSDRHAFAVDDASGTLQIFSRPVSAGSDAELSVRVIHRDVIGGVFGLDEQAVREGAIDYPKSALQTARDVRDGRGTVALYLNPLTPDDVFRVTAAGEVMPQKSTFFYPKLPSGLAFRLLEEEG